MPTGFCGFGLPLGSTEFLLVKFYFTNPKHVPDGIRRINRQDEKRLVQKRIQMLKASAPADTRGVQLVNNAPNTSVEHLFAGLRAVGLALLRVDYWEQTKPGRPTKYVVSFAWGRPQEGLEEVVVNTDAFTNNVVWFCHVWRNPTSVNAVDLVNRQPGQKAKHVALVEYNNVLVRPIV